MLMFTGEGKSLICWYVDALEAVVGHDVGVEELQRMRMHVAVIMQHRILSLTMAADISALFCLSR